MSGVVDREKDRVALHISDISLTRKMMFVARIRCDGVLGDQVNART